MSPRLRQRHPGRREWTVGHRAQLQTAHDFFGDAWGGRDLPMDQRDNWPPPEIAAEMRLAWDELATEIMAEYVDAIRRPWAWWVFEQGLPITEFRHWGYNNEEAEQLDRMGELTPAALAKAANDPQIARGVLNEAHEPAFRRRWGWWRFLSPERRDDEKLEAVQLVDLERRGAEVLTDRERHVIAHKADIPAFLKGCPKVHLLRAECEALGLPDCFIDPEPDE